jgi:hypothetical protein
MVRFEGGVVTGLDRFSMPSGQSMSSVVQLRPGSARLSTS